MHHPSIPVTMVTVVNSKADVLRAMAALNANANAAKGLAEVLKSNLGPRGALKMLVGGAGQIKITKDGSVLLQEMQIQHPTAAMIARAARAQDEETGDGTTSNVLFIAELMKLSERLIADGLHPRLIADGFNLARMEALTFLESFKKLIDVENDRMKLIDVARTSLRTKLPKTHADELASIVVEALECIRSNASSNDAAQVALVLFMVEIMEMKERLTTESRLVKGLVLDHGTRDAEMPKRLEKCFILTLNVSLEFENTEVNSTFFYSSAEEREKLVASERNFTDEKVRKIVRLKNQVCTGDKKDYGFFVVNQKGIDPPSLDMLAKEGIMAVRRAKRRNMERITLACGGNALNSVDDLCASDLGFADFVYEKTLGDDKYTFIEGVANPQSCTILIKGPNDHEINQLKDAVRDGLRAVRNAIVDKCLIPGAGAFELACREHLLNYSKSVSGKTRLGVEVFANALLVIPKTLAENSGFDVQETLIKLEEEMAQSGSDPVGLDLYSGEPISPELEGIFDNYAVKRQMIMLAPILAEQMLLVDEVIRAGKQMGGSGQ
jgi:T-complex protein 1 subunit zeta